MKPAFLRWLGVLGVLVSHTALLAQAAPAPSADPTLPTLNDDSADALRDPRNALRVLRQQQSQVLDAQEHGCYQRFFTNKCLDDVARARRAMQADLRRKEIALDAADRQQRAQEELVRQKEKQQAHDAQLQSIKPADIERIQRERQAERDDKQRDHAAKGTPAPIGAISAQTSGAQADSVTQPVPAKEPELPSGPSAKERAANRAAFDKKQADAIRRLAEREQARAKAAASAASAPRGLPVPAQ